MELYKIINGQPVLIADVSKPDWNQEPGKRGYIANKPPILRKILLKKELTKDPFTGNMVCSHNFGDSTQNKGIERKFIGGDFSIEVFAEKTKETKLFPFVTKNLGESKFELNFGKEKFVKFTEIFIRVVGYCCHDNEEI